MHLNHLLAQSFPDCCLKLGKKDSGFSSAYYLLISFFTTEMTITCSCQSCGPVELNQIMDIVEMEEYIKI